MLKAEKIPERCMYHMQSNMNPMEYETMNTYIEILQIQKYCQGPDNLGNKTV